jgi:hypothetical protein
MVRFDEQAAPSPLRDLVSDTFAQLAPPAGKRHLRALLGEEQGRRFPNSARPASDERDFSFEFSGHESSFSRGNHQNNTIILF